MARLTGFLFGSSRRNHTGIGNGAVEEQRKQMMVQGIIVQEERGRR